MPIRSCRSYYVALGDWQSTPSGESSTTLSVKLKNSPVISKYGSADWLTRLTQKGLSHWPGANHRLVSRWPQSIGHGLGLSVKVSLSPYPRPSQNRTAPLLPQHPRPPPTSKRLCLHGLKWRDGKCTLSVPLTEYDRHKDLWATFHCPPQS